jgi:hypothetical protein
MKADSIVLTARIAILENIKDYLRRNSAFFETGDKKLKTGKGQNVHVYDEDFPDTEMPTVSVHTHICNVEGISLTYHTITAFHINDDVFSFEVCGCDREYFPDELTIEELVGICNFLQCQFETM